MLKGYVLIRSLCPFHGYTIDSRWTAAGNTDVIELHRRQLQIGNWVIVSVIERSSVRRVKS
ncbi:Protein of unknown function [Pyronema omphalodes CBS 100304]|uniref:Uncharacterized protein n=1 Tax=Pyronema omphalodes (strain CBS 100304) TaxID=1076935 RepID=U4L6I3_PYROM|nr:Protein of unknown function [Pyronema omphalodes CBS 100304]